MPPTRRGRRLAKGAAALPQHPAGNLDLGEGGDVHDADTVSNGRDLGADDVVNDVTPERVMVLLRHACWREPAGPFMPENLLEDRAGDSACHRAGLA